MLFNLVLTKNISWFSLPFEHSVCVLNPKQGDNLEAEIFCCAASTVCCH